MTAEQLIARYQELRQRERDGLDTSSDHAVDMLSVCLELGKRGYRLTADESDWIAPETITGDFDPLIADSIARHKPLLDRLTDDDADPRDTELPPASP